MVKWPVVFDTFISNDDSVLGAHGNISVCDYLLQQPTENFWSQSG